MLLTYQKNTVRQNIPLIINEALYRGTEEISFRSEHYITSVAIGNVIYTLFPAALIACRYVSKKALNVIKYYSLGKKLKLNMQFPFGR